MGVLSIVAGVMLTLATPGLDTNDYDPSAQAAVVTQQNEDAPAYTDNSRPMLVVIRFHGHATSENESHADSQSSAIRIDLTPELQASR